MPRSRRPPHSNGRRQCRRHYRNFWPAAADANAIEIALEDPEATLARAKSLRERIFLHFSQKAMVEGVLAGYRDAFANR